VPSLVILVSAILVLFVRTESQTESHTQTLTDAAHRLTHATLVDIRNNICNLAKKNPAYQVTMFAMQIQYQLGLYYKPALSNHHYSTNNKSHSNVF